MKTSFARTRIGTALLCGALLVSMLPAGALATDTALPHDVPSTAAQEGLAADGRAEPGPAAAEADRIALENQREGTATPSAPADQPQAGILANTIQIVVKTPSGDALTLDVGPQSTIGSVKEQLASQLGIPAGSLVLTMSGIALEDGHTIADYSIYENDTLFLSVVSQSVSYVDESGREQNADTATKVDTGITEWNGGWYVVEGDVSVPERITVNGSVNLILSDGCRLAAPKGIAVSEGNSLTVYGQSMGTGALTAQGVDFESAGIGGDADRGCGAVTINGGNITATGGTHAAGIGGGSASKAGAVTINGGAVTATGGKQGAGIGGGLQSIEGTVTISGGSVEATGGDGSAGIGDGPGGAGATFSTGNEGRAFIIASSITDTSGQQNWRGAIIVGGVGQVYQTAVLDHDITIPAGSTLTIPEGATLSISAGAKLTNNGAIDCRGTVDNQGTIVNSGSIAGSIEGDVRHAVTVVVGASEQSPSYGSTVTLTATIRVPSGIDIGEFRNPGSVTFSLGNITIGTAVVTEAEDGFSASVNISLTNNQWRPSQTPYTVTATYSGVDDDSGPSLLLPGTGTTELTVTKADQAAPPSPTMVSRTESHVTLDNPDGAAGSGALEFGCTETGGSEPTGWQPEPIFLGLEPGISYTFHARYAETDYRKASPASTVTIATLGAAGGDTLYEGERLEFPDGTVIERHGDTLTVTPPDGGGDTLITPAEGARVESDGSVNIPGGATVTTGDGTVVTIPPSGGSLQPDGSVSFAVTVTFDSQGGSEVAARTTAINTPVADPGPPSRGGYTFLGWFSSATGGAVWDFDDPVTGDMVLYAHWSRNSTGSGAPDVPGTGQTVDWDDVIAELRDADPGGTIVVDMRGSTVLPHEVLESLAGKDVDLVLQMDGGALWTIRGEDVPDTARPDCDMGIRMDTDDIPENLLDTVAQGLDSTQFTLDHDGAVDFSLTLTLPLGADDAGMWANLYSYDEQTGTLEFQSAGKIDDAGEAEFHLTPASRYAVVIDDVSHEPIELPFDDVPEGAWYEEAVRYVYRRGLMTGTGEDSFTPEGPSTRGQIATILWRLSGSPRTKGPIGFSDVDPTAYYAEAVRWAAAEGVVCGYGDGAFGPDDPITREQFAVMLYRFAAHEGLDVSSGDDAGTLPYLDASEVSGYAVPAIRWACTAGIIQGTSEDTLTPQGEAVRAQAATMLMRYLRKMRR